MKIYIFPKLENADIRPSHIQRREPNDKAILDKLTTSSAAFGSLEKKIRFFAAIEAM